MNKYEEKRKSYNREGSQNLKARKYGLFTQDLKICTKNGKINTTKTGLNKDLVLGDPHPISMVKEHTSYITSMLLQFKTALNYAYNVMTRHQGLKIIC